MMTTREAPTIHLPRLLGGDYRLPYVREGMRPTAMVVGTYLGPCVAIIGADSFDDAWSSALEWMAERGMLATAEPTDDLDEDDGAEWVDGVGWVVTTDVVSWMVRGLD